MVRKKSDIEEIILDAPTQGEIDIFEFIEEYAPNAVSVEIYERMKDGRLAQQERVGIEILRTDAYGYLRSEYDCPSTFFLKFKDATGKFRKGLTLHVGPGPKASRQQSAQVQSPNKPDDYMKELMITLIASLRPPPPPDTSGLLQGVAAMVAALKPANTPDVAAMLGAMAQTWQSLKPSEEDSIKKFKETVSVVRDLLPEAKGEENVLTVVKDLGSQVVDAFRGRTVASNPVASLPATTTTSQLGTQPDSGHHKTQDQLMQEWIRAQLTFLKQKAASGKDVEFWLDYIFENSEEPGCAALLSAVENGATFDHLLIFDPEIRDNPALNIWFKRLYDGLREEIAKSVDTGGPAGDDQNLGDHAGSVDSSGQGKHTSAASGESSTVPFRRG